MIARNYKGRVLIPLGLCLCAKFHLTQINTGFTLFSVELVKAGVIIMGINEIIGDQREQIFALASKYGASNIRVFGSVVRGTADEDSDIDFLVDLGTGAQPF